ncbi:hypothetical protein V6N13_000346 [Hibiscus sabdariffa]|uniref:Uncharacterized protein n=1 Tax=Hibiscus sabdariffa TaxID=183260 RepID=A0ABR2G4Y8_9ROSI
MGRYLAVESAGGLRGPVWRELKMVFRCVRVELVQLDYSLRLALDWSTESSIGSGFHACKERGQGIRRLFTLAMAMSHGPEKALILLDRPGKYGLS